MFLKKEKQYRRLFLAGVVNGIGDRFSQVAMLAMLLQITGSGLAVGITMAIRLVPFFVFGPLGGMLADTFSRKKILVITDLMRIFFALSFLLVDSKGDIWIVYVSSFILAAGEAIYAPARKSTIPQLVKKEHLVKVNSLEQVMVGIVLIGGALSGGVVSYYFGPQMTFWFNGVSFLLAAFVISTITFPEKNQVIREKNRGSFHFSILKKMIMISVPLQVIFLSEIFISSLNGIDNVLISVYAVDVYKLGDMGVGLFYGALGIGLMISFSVANLLKKHFLVIGLSCLMFEGIFLILLSYTQIVVLAFVLFCCVAFMSGIGNTCFDTVLMNEIPEEHRGKMFGLSATVANTLLGLSMFLAGSALEWIEPRMLGMIGGLSFALIAILLILFLFVQKTRLQARLDAKYENKKKKIN